MDNLIIGGPGRGNGGSPPPAAQDLIKDSDTPRFMADVIEASRKVPVLVDFWAPWCGPCKQLTPLLEKVVKQANGKVRLVKINVDENQQLAAQMRIQSIPAVFAFVDGQPVDGFMGALPESGIKQFVDRLGSQGNLAEQIEAAVAAGREALEQKQFAEAAEIFGQVLQADRENVGALAGLAWIWSWISVPNGRPDAATRMNPHTSGASPVASTTNPPSLCPSSQTQRAPVASRAAFTHARTSAA